MKIYSIVPSLVILGIVSCSAQAAPLQFKNYTAKYTLRYDGIPFGKSTTVFNTDGKRHYTLCIDNLTTLPFLHGAVKECSAGLLTSNTVKPLTYDYDYTRNSDHQHIHIDFNWSKKIAVMTTAKTHWHLSIPENTQDKISYQLSLRQGLAQGQTKFSFPIADGGKLKTYTFHREAEKNQTTLVKITRDPTPSKEKISIWFRQDIDYIVSKVKQHKHIADIGTAELDSFTLEKHV